MRPLSMAPRQRRRPLPGRCQNALRESEFPDLVTMLTIGYQFNSAPRQSLALAPLSDDESEEEEDEDEGTPPAPSKKFKGRPSKVEEAKLDAEISGLLEPNAEDPDDSIMDSDSDDDDEVQSIINASDDDEP